ncbi:hypothetical protein [Halomonas ventosae]|uniref:hypothetical protein n=1 Tax=Halomonas ventosae TaxID=229007 RepID=UPI00105CBBC1|nr:hypothetical protein [Halomonas ventosae]
MILFFLVIYNELEVGMKIFYSAVFGSVLLISGCATTPVPTDAALEVPQSKVLNERFQMQEEGMGQVVVKRDSGMSGSACDSRVYANREPVAEIGPSEKVTFYLPLGRQMLAAKATGVCAGGLVEIEASVEKGVPEVYRVSYGSNGEFSIQRTAF